MSQWKYIASVVALSLSTALAGTGCLAQGPDDEATNEPEAAAVAPAPAEETAASDQPGEERTGQTHEAWSWFPGGPCSGWGRFAFPGFGIGCTAFGVGWPGLCGLGCW
jgi:hypothetical protein